MIWMWRSVVFNFLVAICQTKMSNDTLYYGFETSNGYHTDSLNILSQKSLIVTKRCDSATINVFWNVL